MNIWKIFNILFSLCIFISCEKSFDSIVPQKSKPPKPPIIIRTAPPSANLIFSRQDSLNDLYDIYLLDTLGVETRLTFEGIGRSYAVWQGVNCMPVFSPDVSKIAFVSGNLEIYIMNSDGTDQLKLTNHPGRADTPIFSPDGSYLIYSSDRDGNWEIYSMNLDGSNKKNLTQCDSSLEFGPTFSPDGSKIAFCSNRDGGDREIYIMDADGSNQQNLTNYSPYSGDTKPLFSPDGSKILFNTSRGLVYGYIYVMNGDGSNQNILALTAVMSAASHLHKLFSVDGNYVIFEHSNNERVHEPFLPYTWGIYIIDIEGINRRLLSTRARHPTVSPDDSKIAFCSDGELYQINIDGTEKVRLTDNKVDDQMPVFQPVIK